VAEGLRYVLRTPLPRTIALGIGLCNLVLGGFDTVVILFLARQLRQSAGLIGVLLAVGSVGGMLGAALAGRVARRLGDARTPVLMTAAMVPAGLLLPLTGTGWGLAWFVAGSVLFTAAVGVFNVCVISAIQATTPPGMLGRVAASVRVFTRGALPLGALFGGALASVFAPRWALATLMLLLVPLPVVFRLSPLGRAREIRELAPAEPGPAASTLAA
jgi:MFS family permease